MKCSNCDWQVPSLKDSSRNCCTHILTPLVVLAPLASGVVLKVPCKDFPWNYEEETVETCKHFKERGSPDGTALLVAT